MVVYNFWSMVNSAWLAFTSDPVNMAKACAVIVLGLGSFLLSVLPMNRLFGSESGSRTVSLSMCFSGGVLLFTTLVHMQPEVRNQVERLQHEGWFWSNESDSGRFRIENLGELLFCAGFFLVFFVDDVVHTMLDKSAANSASVHGGAEVQQREVLRRSMSLRRRNLRKSCTIPRPSLVEPLSDDQYGMPMSIKSDRGFPRTVDEEEGNNNGDENGAAASFRCLITVLALSFHEVFEGLAIGLANNARDVWCLFVAVASHKLIIAFCIGLELTSAKTRKSLLILSTAVFAAITPAGIGAGVLLGSKNKSGPGCLEVVLQGLAAGTLLYVVFFEVLARHKQSGLKRLLFVFVGFVTMLVLQTILHYFNFDLNDDE